MIAHIGVIVSDVEKSGKWYEEALRPIGYAKLMEFGKAITQVTDVAGFGEENSGKPGLRRYHEHYYAAFVLDPDGHNIEVVCHTAE